jgi:anti-sigma B factor antagonist
MYEMTISKMVKKITTIFNFPKFLIPHLIFCLKLGVKNGINAMQLRYKTQETDGVLVFSFEEESISHDLASELKELVFLKIAEGFSKIVFDLTSVKEIDSSGLGALLFGKRQASGNEGDLRLVGVSESVQNMIRIAQLSRVFEIHSSIQKAVDAFK